MKFLRVLCDRRIRFALLLVLLTAVLLTAGVVGVIVVLASLLSIRKVLVLEPAVVFR